METDTGLRQLNLAADFGRLNFRHRATLGDTTLYHGFYRISETDEGGGDVFLHVSPSGFTVFIAFLDAEGQTSEMPCAGYGLRPEQAFAEALKALYDLPHGQVVHPVDESLLPF